MFYLIEQTTGLLIVGIALGFLVAWFLYKTTPVLQSEKRLQTRRQMNRRLKNELASCEHDLKARSAS